MSAYVVSAEAIEDIFQIWCYLAEHATLDVANRIEDELYAAFESLAEMPGKGHKRSDLTSHRCSFLRSIHT